MCVREPPENDGNPIQPIVRNAHGRHAEGSAILHAVRDPQDGRAVWYGSALGLRQDRVVDVRGRILWADEQKAFRGNARYRVGKKLTCDQLDRPVEVTVAGQRGLRADIVWLAEHVVAGRPGQKLVCNNYL